MRQVRAGVVRQDLRATIYQRGQRAAGLPWESGPGDQERGPKLLSATCAFVKIYHFLPWSSCITSLAILTSLYLEMQGNEL